MSRSATDGIDYTNRDYEAYKEMMIEKLREKMPEYTDTSETDAGIVIIECLANGLDILSMYNDAVANDCFLPTTQDRRIAVQIARQLQYVPKNQSASVIEMVFVLNGLQEEPITIPKGTSVSTIESNDYEQVYFETIEDLIIPIGKLGNEKSDDRYIYTVRAIQGITINEDLVGTSKGTPYQEFRLGSVEVLTDTIELYVDEGDGSVLWEQVNNFINSDETDNHYTVEVDEFDNCYIQFGNGSRGRIPLPFDNGITATYKIGGGEIGNVSPNTVIEMEEEIAFVDSCFNPYPPLILGNDKESIDSIRENAPAQFRTQNRAITLKDYEDLFKINFKEITDIVAVQNSQNIFTVDLYFFMKEGYSLNNLIPEFTEFIDTKVIPGTLYNFNEYQKCNVSFNDIKVASAYGYDENTVRQEVEDYIRDILFEEGYFKFRSNFYLSDLEIALINEVDGVATVRIMSDITGENVTTGETYSSSQMIINGSTIQAPKDYEIMFVDGITINML